MKREDEAYHRWTEEENSNGVETFGLSNNGKFLALGRFDMEEKKHREQCEATDGQIEIEAPSPCSDRVSTRHSADTASAYT